MARYGIGEWYGHLFSTMAPSDRRNFARMQVEKLPERKTQPCPFRSRPGATVRCSKEGGVCSIRPYESSEGLTTVGDESGAERQLRNIASLPFVYHHVAAMADVHLGKGATVGSVIATKKAVIPVAAGVDIGCRRMGREAHQGEIGLVVGDEYFAIHDFAEE